MKAGQDFPVIMSSFCIGAIACDRFRFIMQPHKTQMTANQVTVLLIINNLLPMIDLCKYTMSGIKLIDEYKSLGGQVRFRFIMPHKIQMTITR